MCLLLFLLGYLCFFFLLIVQVVLQKSWKQVGAVEYGGRGSLADSEKDVSVREGL